MSNLQESRNEWCARLVNIFTPLVVEGMKSIFQEAYKLCSENEEMEKYLMTFQNLLSRIPKWNQVLIEDEVKRIIERSGCNYLEDLISCVHVIQLKVLTCVRVGNKQKKIDISIPNLNNFVHKIYIHSARKCYSNVYLFDVKVSPLIRQKHNRELEQLIQECILTTVRESIPTEQIIRAYMDESEEQEEEVIIEDIKPEEEVETVKEEKEEKKVEDEKKDESFVPTIKNIDEEPVLTRLSFNDIDSVQDAETGDVKNITASKDIDVLEEISNERAMQRKLEEEEDDSDKIQIHTDELSLNDLGIIDMNSNNDVLSLGEIEVLG